MHQVGGRIPGQREWLFRLAKGSTEAALADRIFDAMEREQLGYEWTTVGLLWQLLGCLLGMHSDIKPPQSRQQITRMKNVLTYIRNNYGEPITLDELAAVVPVFLSCLCSAHRQDPHCVSELLPH